MYISQVLIFWGRGSHNPYVSDMGMIPGSYSIFHMALRQAHGISSYMIWLSAACYYMFACGASDPQVIFL